MIRISFAAAARRLKSGHLNENVNLHESKKLIHFLPIFSS